MFHSSGSRHEQYIVRSHTKATLNKKRSSLESEVSGADSGYTSSSSTPSSVCSPTNTDIDHVTSAKNEARKDSLIDTSKNTIKTTDTQVVPTKKKKTKRQQPPRQPDLVYSCPRPLAFPFHNDDHFLPIAEADPRDVARVSPSLNRSSSLQSSKTSIGSTRMYDNYHYSGSNTIKGVDTESSYSRQSSILSTIQRGTVRSIRSFFQLPDSLSNSDGLSRSPTNNTSHTQYSANTRRTDNTTFSSSVSPSLERLEIKKGTVQSIRDMFSRKRSSIQAQKVPQPISSKQQKGFVGATIGQFESSANSNYSRANVSAIASNSTNTAKKLQTPPATFKPVAVNVTKSDNSSKSIASRAAEFASRAIWKPKSPVVYNPPPVAKPLSETPAQPTPKKSLKREFKKLSARVLAIPKTWKGNDEGNISLPQNVAPSAPQQKRSIFSSFRRADISASVSDNKKPTVTSTSDIPPSSTTAVGKMWKSFKSLVSGKKTSRVGVL
ncbi:unnamed protein product [Mucor hiemalis]